MDVALGKVYKLCRVFWCWHSVNLRNFAECFRVDTRQSWEILPSVFFLTLGKLEKLCRVFFRRALGKIDITVPSRQFFCRVFIDTRQTVCRVPDKKHSANYCLPTNQYRVLYAECNTRQTVCRVPLALDKSTVSVVRLKGSLLVQRIISVLLIRYWEARQWTRKDPCQSND